MPPSRRLLWLSRLAFAALACFAVVVAMLPDNGGVHLSAWDKVEHFICFYVLAAAAAFAFPRTRLIWIGVGLSALGGAIELAQALPIISRDCDVKDWITDTFAVACALGPFIIADWRERWRAAEAAGGVR